MGVDTASGKENANESVATIISIHTGQQVAIVAGRYTPDELGAMAIQAGNAYYYKDKKNPCEIAVEREFHGQTIIDKLISINYPNIYYHSYHHVAFRGGANEYGWDSRKYRQTAIDWLQEDFGMRNSKIDKERQRAVFVNDLDTLSQMKSFERNEKTGRFEAKRGKFDDRVAALYIANFVRRERMDRIFNPPAIEKPHKETWEDVIVAGTRKPEERDPGPRNLYD